MVLYVVDAVRLVGANLGALLLDTALTNPSSSDTATLGLLDIVAEVPDPRACVLRSLAP